MTRLLFVYVFICFSICGDAQKYDYQWPFGYGANFSNNFGISLLDFNENLVTVDSYAEVEVFELGDGGSFICNAMGELILMTNNCEIVNSSFDVIENGSEITPGITHNDYCPFGDYPADQSSLFIPEITNDSTYYLLHKESELWPEELNIVSRKFYLSTIVERTNGSFYLKDKTILYDNNMIINRLTSGINHSQDKWWTYAIDYASNRFHFFLIGGEEGYETIEVQEIEIPITTIDVSIGQTMFSPDGTLLALNSTISGVLLYDFDNETGQLSNFRNIPYPNMDTALGLVFSPNSRFIYLSTAENVYQLDLEETDTSLAITHLAHIRSFDETGWPVGLGYMYLGPDCRIYVSPGSTTFYLHVIHQPNQKGLECELEERAIRTPTIVEFDLPNLPMYRFGGNCDNNIEWGIPTAIVEPAVVEAFEVFPNPATSELNVAVPASLKNQVIHVYNTIGQIIKTQIVMENPQAIDIHSVAPGIYFIGNETVGLKKWVKIMK